MRITRYIVNTALGLACLTAFPVPAYAKNAPLPALRATLSPPSQVGGETMPGYSPDTFDADYNSLATEYNELAQLLPRKLTHKTARVRVSRAPVKKEYVTMRRRYFEIREWKKRGDKIHELKKKLNAMYFKNAPESADRDSVNTEAVRLAVGIMDEIDRLRGKYKSFFIPIFHNMMIDVGMKKRGACKHWAADLLKYLKKVDRQHFVVTWGEAHPGTIMEHNVAVLYPHHGKFDDGLMVDPWRTGGLPFWAHVTEDPHYDWKKWPLYGVY